MGKLLDALLWLDRAVNVLLGGTFRETLSARAHRSDVKDHPYWGWTASAINKLFFWQVDHCKTQWEYEQVNPFKKQPMNDKVLHFIAGTVIAVIAGLLITPWAALPIAVLAGSIKEFYDSFYPDKHTVDTFDFIATGLGGLLGAMIVLIILYYEITVVLFKYLLNTY